MCVTPEARRALATNRARSSAVRIALLLTFCLPLSLSADVPPTPSEADIPTPVPAESTLAGSDRPDIARFLNVGTADAPSLSPDGTRLAFRTKISGEPQLWVVAAEGGWPTQLTFGEPVTFHAWSPAGDWLVYGTDRNGNEREGFYLISPDGTKERELLAPSDAFRVFGSFTRDGRTIAYATTERTGVDFDIHLLDVASGNDQQVFQGERGLFAQSFRPDGGAILLTETRGEDSDDVHLFDVASGSLTPLFVPEVRSAHGSFSWTPDGDAFYMASNQERNFAALARYELATRELSWLETPDRDVEEVKLSADGRFLAWTENVGGYSSLRVRDLTTGEEVGPVGLPAGVYQFGWASAAPVASIRVASPLVPGDVWTWNAVTGELHRATHSSSAGLDLDTMVVPEAVSFEARDGLTVHGLLYLPRAMPEGMKPPLLLAVHGGPTSQARPRFRDSHQYLLTRGIAVFDLNFRGSTGYGKRYARLNDLRLRENELYDLADAVEWLKEDGRVDASRAAVMGGSYGGYLTMAAVTRLPEHFDAGVAFVGVSNWITALEGASPQLKASDLLEYGNIDDPDDREFLERISPIAYIDNVSVPVMVLHGANDPRDPVTESDQFVRGIREGGGEVEYLRFPDEGHGIRRLSNRMIAFRRVAAFLERMLAP